METDRYIRQTTFEGIGKVGAERIKSARVAVIGLGALGTVTASQLARAGVGFLKIIDRDCVESSNLQRQALYTERDAEKQMPKAVAARDRLAAINSEIKVEAVIADVNAINIESLVCDVGIVLDGTDNFEARFLINEICHKLEKPWIYAGALGASGATMNVLPDGGPCFRCLFPEMPAPGSHPTCGTAGVLAMATSVAASIESAEALKILTGSPSVSRLLLTFDLWNGVFERFEIMRDPDCAVCGKRTYETLARGAKHGDEDWSVTPLCTEGTYQVSPWRRAQIDIAGMATKLGKIGAVSHNGYLLRFDNEDVSFSLFCDGRTVIRGVRDESAAKSVFAEYIGL
jgi:adenylyltransferase/sulfurtransferase